MSHMTPARWEQATEAPLMVAALGFLVAYAVPILNPDLPGWAARRGVQGRRDPFRNDR